MGRRSCIALLLFICSCSLDTTPDIQPASANQKPDASAPKWQEAQLRYDPPRASRQEDPVVRKSDDEDAGDTKPDSRHAGRSASDRPATSPSRDAGVVDAGAKQESTKPVGPAPSEAVSDKGSHASDATKPDSGSMLAKPQSAAAGSGVMSQQHDAGAADASSHTHDAGSVDDSEQHNGNGDAERNGRSGRGRDGGERRGNSRGDDNNNRGRGRDEHGDDDDHRGRGH